MQNFNALHGTLGGAVVLLNIIVALVLIPDRRHRRPIGSLKKLVAYLGQLLLLAQVLIGLDLWTRGFRPAPGLWALLHLILPIGALLFAVMMLVRMRRQHRKEHATMLSKAAWHTAMVAIVAYLIGMLG